MIRAAEPGSFDTVIVGAGIAGLACARRLHEAGQPFVVLTECVGGRICRSQDGAVNLGAYYVRADYNNVNRFVCRARRIDRLTVRRHDASGYYGVWNPRLFSHLPQSVRFLRLLGRFRVHYEAFKLNCLTMPRHVHCDPIASS